MSSISRTSGVSLESFVELPQERGLPLFQFVSLLTTFHFNYLLPNQLLTEETVLRIRRKRQIQTPTPRRVNKWAFKFESADLLMNYVPYVRFQLRLFIQFIIQLMYCVVLSSQSAIICCIVLVGTTRTSVSLKKKKWQGTAPTLTAWLTVQETAGFPFFIAVSRSEEYPDTFSYSPEEGKFNNFSGTVRPVCCCQVIRKAIWD